MEKILTEVKARSILHLHIPHHTGQERIQIFSYHREHQSHHYSSGKMRKIFPWPQMKCFSDYFDLDFLSLCLSLTLSSREIQTDRVKVCVCVCVCVSCPFYWLYNLFTQNSGTFSIRQDLIQQDDWPRPEKFSYYMEDCKIQPLKSLFVNRN